MYFLSPINGSENKFKFIFSFTLGPSYRYAMILQSMLYIAFLICFPDNSMGHFHLIGDEHVGQWYILTQERWSRFFLVLGLDTDPKSIHNDELTLSIVITFLQKRRLFGVFSNFSTFANYGFIGYVNEMDMHSTKCYFLD